MVQAAKGRERVHESDGGEHPRRCRGEQHVAGEADHVREEDRVPQPDEVLVPAQVDPQERQADDRELGVPVGPRGGRNQEVRRVGDALRRLLEEMAREPLLDVDHAEAVQHRLRGVAVGEAADALVGEVEADPDHDLEAEIDPAARQKTASGDDDCVHDAILAGPAGATDQPPMYDISILLRAEVSPVRNSE